MYYSIHLSRAVAAILVVCYHIAGNLAKDKYFGVNAKFLDDIFCFGGSAGVCFFFVLSGFIISYIHYNDIGDVTKLRPYFMKRVVRIYPTYIIIFMFVYGLALLVPSLRDSMPGQLSVLIKSLLLVPQDAKVVGGTGAPVIVVAWSLQYEVMFYLLFASAIFNKWFGRAVLLFIFIGFIYHNFIQSAPFPISFIVNRIVSLFSIGMLVSVLAKNKVNIPAPGLVAILSSCAFFTVGAAFCILRSRVDIAYFEILYGIFAGIILISLIRYEDSNPEKFKKNKLAILGDCSYALYLIHFPIIAVLCKLVMAAKLRGSLGAVIAFCLILPICILVAALYFRFIERPLLKFLTKRLVAKS